MFPPSFHCPYPFICKKNAIMKKRPSCGFFSENAKKFCRSPQNILKFL
ncbi:hypothetical protein AB434_0485 [Heyndrickxia coagulans]|uniref:Uncharacterized protein n=1 Tax=Heyndrickxia coagulans TaxID=1398 RepID=A0AAN0T451_HEYCO|nr:hypothetical protein SB48_HM08orf01059 [Heyndrickxia coagulans]AKN52890.1 hypothetical protein AB434_0485 [Heyndrickxia coagulans]